jgi:hypothetical protein
MCEPSRPTDIYSAVISALRCTLTEASPLLSFNTLVGGLVARSDHHWRWVKYLSPVFSLHQRIYYSCVHYQYPIRLTAARVQSHKKLTTHAFTVCKILKQILLYMIPFGIMLLMLGEVCTKNAQRHNFLFCHLAEPVKHPN